MRTAEDVLRSLKRHVWTALGDDYEVRIEGEEGAFVRPFARVITANEAEFADTTRFLTTMVQPYAIYVYPPAGLDAQDARLIAAATEEDIYQAFKVGIADGRPDRLPLYDYDGVPTTEGVVGRGQSDFARVTNLTVGPMRDPTDNRLYTVVVNLRLRWNRTTEPVRGGRVVEDVIVSPGDLA